MILSNGLLSESSNYSRYYDHLVNCFSLCHQQPITPPVPALHPDLALALRLDLAPTVAPAFASPPPPIEDENNHMGLPSDERIEW